jgi:Ran GTPase-activating protein (RanGAP) involved in mRNA processing and transport
VAREYQVYSLFQEMMTPLRQLNESEKQQLKYIAFNNAMMHAIPDQRKFIRDIKNLVKNGTYAAYFEEQQKWGDAIREKFEVFDVRSKADVDKFAEDNADITEELQCKVHVLGWNIFDVGPCFFKFLLDISYFRL